MNINEIIDRMFCDYVLVIMKPSGIFSRRYFLSYDEMDDYAIYLQFSPNVVKAQGLHRKGRRWIRCFTIG